MAKKKRVTRKQLLKEPDEFLTFSAKVIRFAAENQRAVLFAAVGLAVALMLFAGVRYYFRASEHRAQVLLEQALAQYKFEAPADKGATSRDAAAEHLEKLLSKYPSTSAARLGLVVYGDLSYDRGDYQKALELYQKALEAFSGETTLEKLIWNGLAHAYEAKKDYNSAAGYFQKITDSQDEFMKADAYFDLGRMMEARNRKEEARKAYNKVVKDYPDSAGFRIAKERARSLEGA